MTGAALPGSDEPRTAPDPPLLALVSATRARAREAREHAAPMRARARDDLERLRDAVDRVRQRLEAADARADHLQRALISNRRIGMAIGILMVVRQLTEEEAFCALQRASSHRNTKLREIAEEVIYTGHA